MKNKFEHPIVVGVVGGNLQRCRKLSSRFESKIKAAGLNIAYLPLRVEPRHLKNLFLCMRLMDIIGANVIGKYEKRVVKYIDKLDISAKKAKRVNIIAKKGGKFIGYFSNDILNNSLPKWIASI